MEIDFKRRIKLRNLFVDKLLKIEWWKFDNKKLMNYAQYFTNPDQFISKVDK